MGLKRFNTQTIVQDYSASAGWTSDAVDVSKVESIGVYVKVDGATDINLLVETVDGYVVYDTITFTGAGFEFWNIWSFPFGSIKFQTSNAVTLTIQVFYKA